MPLGSFRLNSLSKKKGALARFSSNFIGTRNGTTTGQFSNALNQSSTATIVLPSGIKIGNGSAGTIEFWFKLNSIVNQVKFAGTPGDGVQLMCNTANGNQVRIAPNNSSGEYKNEWAVSTGTWYHIAITTSGDGTWNHYVNGTKRSTAAGWNYAGEITRFGFGSNGGNVAYDEIRFSNNIRYTASFSVATAPFANDDNTLALFHCESTSETDEGAIFQRIPATISGSRINSGTAKFGSASHTSIGGGSGINLEINHTDALNIGSSGKPGTVEFFYRRTSSGNNTNQGGIANIGKFTCSEYGGRFWIEDGSYNAYASITNPATNTWHHIVIQTDGAGTWQMYLNGTRAYNASTSTNFESMNFLRDGQNGGYLVDEIRISKIARYTGTSITVPTAAFTNDADTLALFHCNSTSETDDIS